MRFDCNFGSLGSAKRAKQNSGDGPFRIALLGDFSGRALAGQLETGDELAKRKPIRVDLDNLDDVVERMELVLRLPAGDDDESFELEIESMDDFHPDEIYDKVEAFEELKGLRQRLLNDRTSAAAAEEIKQWAEELGIKNPGKHRRKASRGSTVPVSGKLSDFARLTGRPVALGDEEPDLDEWLKRIVAPHVKPDQDDDIDALVAAVDESLSAMMRSILHQPDFQSVEAVWRGVEMLIRRLELDTSLQVVLYDISAEELAADLSSSDDLQETGLYRLLVEQPSMDANQGALSVLLGHYVFDETPPHAELLGRMAQIAAAANAPFVASISKHVLERSKKEQPHPLVVEAWTRLKELPEAKYLGLTVPRFMLRMPYGKKTDPIDPFEFEEFTRQSGVSGMLWGNGVLLIGLMLGETYRQQGLAKMQIGSVMSFHDIPYTFWVDDDGDQVALPCTDRLLSERMAHAVIDSGYIPVLSIQGQPVVRLGSVRSVGGEELAGVWPPSEQAAQWRKAEQDQADKQLSDRLAERRKSSAAAADDAADGGFRDDLKWDTKDGSFDDDDDDEEDDLFGDSSDDSLDMGSLDDDDDSNSLDSDDSDNDAHDSEDDSDDLDALLASMTDDTADEPDGDDSEEDDDDDSDDGDMDDELAALLADL